MKKHTRLLAVFLSMVLLASVAPLSVCAKSAGTESTTSTAGSSTQTSEEDTPVALSEEENEPEDAPATVAVDSNVNTIVVPLSGDAQDTTYAVAIENPIDDPLLPTAEDDDYINVWKGTAGTRSCVYVSGKKLGSAEFILDGKTYTVHVVPRNESASNTNKSIKISASNYDSEKVTMYYSINGSALIKADPNKVDINQTFPGGFNVMIFAAPKKGYALTKLTANTGAGQFYSLAGEKEDGSDSNAWPFVNPDADDTIDLSLRANWKDDPIRDGYQHGFSGCLTDKNMKPSEMRAMFKEAKKLGCDGVLTYTRNSSTGLDITISCEAEELPTMDAKITQYKKKGSDTWLDWDEDNAPELEVGDTLKYTYTITRSLTQNINYRNIVLKDDVVGFTQNLNYNSFPAGAKKLEYYAEYTITTNSEEAWKYATGTFTNDAVLTYEYESKYSKGTTKREDKSSVNCTITNIITFSWCEHLPEHIKSQIKLPDSMVVPYNTTINLPTLTKEQKEFDVKENGYVTGTWKLECWGAENKNLGANVKEYYDVNETGLIMRAGSVHFVGHWNLTPAPKYGVTYTWSGLPDGLTGSSAPALPTEGGTYFAGQPFTVDSYYQAGETITVGSEAYVFSGWVLDETVVSGETAMVTPAAGQTNVTLTGEWIKASDLVTMTISTENCEAVDENQVFLFRVTGEGLDVVVPVTGNSSAKVSGVHSGKTYTVTELSDWSWRYDPANASQQVTVTEEGTTVNYGHSRTGIKWLDGNTFKNILKNTSEGDV